MKYLARIAGTSLRSTVLLVLISTGLAACGADGPSAASLPSLAARSGTIIPTTRTPITTPGAPPVSSTVEKAAPSISGKSVASINAGSKYQFIPTASGPAGATLTFSIQNKPEWANFDTASGALSGTPAPANVGTYSNIIVSVSDGSKSASLAAFSVAVNQISSGAATLDWIPPTQNVDGSALTNLAGYKVYYGSSAANLSQSVSITNPGLTSFTVSNLSSGNWYFAVSSVTSAGVESTPSAVVTTSL